MVLEMNDMQWYSDNVEVRSRYSRYRENVVSSGGLRTEPLSHAKLFSDNFELRLFSSMTENPPRISFFENRILF